MDIAPGLYKLVWRKNRKVREELQDQSCTRGLWRMSTVEEMAEFVTLWDLVQQVSLSNQEDQLAWRWTANASYSSKSAYLAQFNGSYCSFEGSYIWKAHAKGKHKFFAWLLVQSKILTADKLIKRAWPCDPVCPLCDQEQETAAHLCLDCVLAQEVWYLMQVWSDGLGKKPERGVDIEIWWRSSLLPMPKDQRRHVAALLMYTAWNIWKERNGRVFEGKTMTAPLVFNCILEEMGLRASSFESAKCLVVLMLVLFLYDFVHSMFYVIST